LSSYLFWYCIKLVGTPFLRNYLDFYPQSLEQPGLNKCFWVEYASYSTWVG
jgi:hypothetical protein